MSGESNGAFNQALSNFIHDFASGGAIRHLADEGFSVTEITDRLSFPTPKNRVAQEVWKYYLETGKIRLEKPKLEYGRNDPERSDGERGNTETIRKVTYVKEQNAYGRVSMRQVVEEIPVESRMYIACDFGKQMYRDREGFERRLNVLTEKERQYILDLPWPVQTVYHVADERMQEIIHKLTRDN